MKTDRWQERERDVIRRRRKQGEGEVDQAGILSEPPTNFSGIYIMCQALF